MGGDHGPHVTVPAALSVLKDKHDLKLILIGDQGNLEQELRNHRYDNSSRLIIQHASEQVAMDESPSSALRNKKDSSIRVAVNLVKQGTASACVSAGNTGALMAISRFVLKTLPGVERPAIVSTIPSIKGHTHMLDLGANVDSSAEQLFQFAIMGSVLTSAVDNIQRPTVGLLNIGEEEMKGNERVKEAARMLEESDINYAGFVEGDDVYKGTVDVVVCDGFVGNVALKTSEGVARMISHFMKEEFARNPLTKMAAAISSPVLNALKGRIDPRKYNGASFIGLQGIVIKSHGSADVLSFATAIREAIQEVEKDVPQLIGSQLEALFMARDNA